MAADDGTGGVAAAVRWDGALYAGHTAHHRRYDDHVLAGCEAPANGNVLDVGCGVGDLTVRLRDLVPRGSVVGIDADPSMVACARARYGDVAGVSFACARAQDLSDACTEQWADLVVSIAVLHWVPRADHPAVLGELARVLRPGGRLRAEFGGAGQIAAARAVLDPVSAGYGGPRSPWWFPSPADYLPLLDAAGLSTAAPGHVRLVRQRRPVPDAAALDGWLRSQVLPAYEASLPLDRRAAFATESVRHAVAVLRRADGSYDQDYVRLDVLAVRRRGA